MFLSGSHSGLTSAQADTLQADLQERADLERSKIMFSRTGTANDVALAWTVVLAPPPAPAATVGAAPAPSSMSSAAGAAFRFFVDSGWSPAQAAGVLGNIEAESGFNASAIGDHGSAFGICQWHADRQAQFRNHFGHSMQGSTLEEQLIFVNFELREGNETRAGKLLKGATSAGQAGRIVSTNYERPGDIAGSETTRAALAEKWFAALSRSV